MRFGSTGAEQAAGESLDQLIAEEEPDVDAADGSAALGWDENATDQDIARLQGDQGADAEDGPADSPGPDEDSADDDLTAHDDLMAHDAGIDGGGATAEEAAVHVISDDDSGPGSGELCRAAPGLRRCTDRPAARRALRTAPRQLTHK